MSYLRRACGIAVLLRVASVPCSCGGDAFSIPGDAACLCCDKRNDGVNNTNVVAKLADCSDNTTVLNLNSNSALTSLPSDVLARFKELCVVDFAECPLTAFPQELFKFNLELYWLRIINSDIKNGGLPADLLKFNTKIAFLNWKGNPFTQVPAGFLANQNNLKGWSWPPDAQCSVKQVTDTCEARTSAAQAGTLFYNVALPEPTAEHEQVVCLKEKTKVKCPTGEFFELRAAYFGRSDVADTTCAANYDATPDHTCAASEQLLASSLHEKCNGKRTCKLKSGKKQLKAYGLQKSCNPILQVQYNCIPNAGIVQKKKQVKKARKQAKRTGDWDAFFDMLSAA